MSALAEYLLLVAHGLQVRASGVVRVLSAQNFQVVMMFKYNYLTSKLALYPALLMTHC